MAFRPTGERLYKIRAKSEERQLRRSLAEIERQGCLDGSGIRLGQSSAAPTPRFISGTRSPRRVKLETDELPTVEASGEDGAKKTVKPGAAGVRRKAGDSHGQGKRVRERMESVQRNASHFSRSHQATMFEERRARPARHFDRRKMSAYTAATFKTSEAWLERHLAGESALDNAHQRAAPSSAPLVE